MGVFLCKDSPVSYEISTPGQGIVYLILTAIYIGLETYCIVETIKICKTQKNIRKNYVLLAAHGCIHMLFIRDIIFMPGGVLICYGKFFYAIVSSHLYIIKHVIILIMLYQILCILLDSYTIPARKRYFKTVIIIMIIVDIILHTVVFIISYISPTDAHRLIRDIFSIIDAAAIMVVFNYFMEHFKSFLKRMQKFVSDSGDYKATLILRISVNGCFIARIIYKVKAVITIITGALSFGDTFGHAIYMAIYYFFNEMFPCMMIFHAMKKGGKEHYMKLDVMFKINKKQPAK